MGATIYEEENVSVKEFYKTLRHEFEGTPGGYRMKVIIEDGSTSFQMDYITPTGSKIEFSKRTGRLEIGANFERDVLVRDFYEKVRDKFEEDKFNYKVSVMIDDNVNPVHLIFETPKGPMADQTKRKGRLEIRTE